MENKLKEIKTQIDNLEAQEIYIDLNINDLEICIENPSEYECMPSDLVGDMLFNIDNARDEINKLYDMLDSLQDLLYEKDL